MGLENTMLFWGAGSFSIWTFVRFTQAAYVKSIIEFPATHGHVGSRRACGQTRRFEKASEGRGSGFGLPQSLNPFPHLFQLWLELLHDSCLGLGGQDKGVKLSEGKEGRAWGFGRRRPAPQPLLSFPAWPLPHHLFIKPFSRSFGFWFANLCVALRWRLYKLSSWRGGYRNVWSCEHSFQCRDYFKKDNERMEHTLLPELLV